MKTQTDPGGADTNVLVYATDASTPQHAAAWRLVFDLPVTPLTVVPQTCSEFLSAVTGKRVPTRRTPAEAITLIRDILALPHVVLLPDPPDLTARFLALLAAHPVAGPKVYDRRLAAALLAHRVPTLYTFNTADFAGVGGVSAVEPTP